jgi:filamentous hemagglutinin family protein
MRSLFVTLPLVILGFVASINPVRAQVSSDGSLSTTVTSPDGSNFTIENGDRAGGNLFHSFSQFSVPTGGSAVFQNPDVQNIISRVTGGSISNIDGLIRTQGSANLFLLNPAGIFFGPNASLNIGGSFFGTTANSLLFPDGVEFSATNLQAPPLLSVNIPIGLRFRDNPGNITNQSAFQVPSQKTLALIGGNVSIDSGILYAPGGRVELGGLTQAGTVRLNPDNSLSFPDGVARGDVAINKGIVSVSAVEGNSGDINIQGNSFSLDNAVLTASQVGEGNAGNVVVKTQGTVTLANNSLILSNVGNRQGTPSVGNVGKILIEARDVSLNNGSELQAGFYENSKGNPGIVTVWAKEFVSLTNSGIFTDVYSGTIGNGSNIEIVAGSVSLSDATLLRASNQGQGKGGNINITATNGSVSLTNGTRLEASNQGQGNSGDINITATDESVYLTNGARLETGSIGQGNAGNITVKAQDIVSLADSSLIRSNVGNPEKTLSIGNVGNITIEAREVSLTNGSQLQAGFYENSKGNPGIVAVRARESFSLGNGGIFTNVEFGAVGDGSNIEISAKSVLLNDGALLEASNSGQGNGGDIIITAPNGLLSLTNNSQINSSIYGQGDAGEINITTGSLSVNNASAITAITNGDGDAGNLFIKASDLVEVLGTGKPGGTSGLSADVEEGGRGDAGNLTIETKKLVVRNSQVGTTVLGEGNAGTFTVNASESIEVKGRVFFTDDSGKILSNPAGLFAQVNFQGEGKGGNLFIETPYLSVSDGAKVQVATFGLGDAGNLFIRASEIDVFDPTATNQSLPQAGIFAGVLIDSDQPPEVPLKGNGGTVTIETDRLRVRDGGRVSVLTQGDGDAGILQIRAKDSIEVFGTSPDGDVSEISANATSESTGSAGSLTINTRNLTVRDRGRINVSNGNTKQAGNLEINADSIKLDNQGSITATSKSGNGGNITFNLRDYLLMRRNSEISTSAGTNQTGGNGGNITINTPDGFVIAFPSENSDITANAFTGKGGNVQINAAGIYGIQFRDKRTPNSDITASSEFGNAGTVELNTPDINPSQGLTELPENVTDPSDKIAENACQRGVNSNFVITGRGGLPYSPNEFFSSDKVRVDLVEATTSTSNSQSAKINQPIIDTTSKQIIPARGWVYNNKGEVVLTAYDPTATNPQRTSQTTAGCPAPF